MGKWLNTGELRRLRSRPLEKVSDVSTRLSAGVNAFLTLEPGALSGFPAEVRGKSPPAC